MHTSFPKTLIIGFIKFRSKSKYFSHDSNIKKTFSLSFLIALPVTHIKCIGALAMISLI